MKKRLIVHIGAGKTGSSSIQAALKDSSELLSKYKTKYVGLLLEHLPKLYSWQSPGGSSEYLKLAVGVTKEQVVDLLAKHIAENSGDEVLVWSNELMFGQHAYFIPALKEIKELGVDVLVVCYLREHGSWSVSAYEQWGIKHKTYRGSIKSYSDYFRDNPIRFLPTLRPWINAFPGACLIRNFQARGDVVKDFFSLLGINQEINYQKVNERLTSEELLVRAVFNNSISRAASPVEFIRQFALQRADLSRYAADWLSSLLPNGEEIENVRSNSADDLAQINEILTDAGEPLLIVEPINVDSHVLSHDRLLMIILQMLVSLSDSNAQLAKSIDCLAEQLENKPID